MKRIPRKPDFNMVAAGAAVVAVSMPDKTPRQCREIASDVYDQMVKLAPDLKTNNPYPDLTPRQAMVFEMIHELAIGTRRGLRMPNLREIGSAMGIAYQNAYYHVLKLEEKGYLKRHDGKIVELGELADV